MSSSTSSNASMSVDGSNTDVINQQLREQLVIVMNRIQELEDRDRQRQNGQNVGQQPANANGNTIKAAKPPMYSGDIGTDAEAWLFQVGQYEACYDNGVRERCIV